MPLMPGRLMSTSATSRFFVRNAAHGLLAGGIRAQAAQPAASAAAIHETFARAAIIFHDGNCDGFRHCARLGFNRAGPAPEVERTRSPVVSRQRSADRVASPGCPSPAGFPFEIVRRFPPSAGACSASRPRRRRPASAQTRPLSSTAMIQSLIVGPDSQADFAGVRVADHVVQRFLDRQEQIVPHLRRYRALRRMFHRLHPAPDIGCAQKFDRELAEIIDQIRQRVVPRIDRPDDFVQRLDHLSGGR